MGYLAVFITRSVDIDRGGPIPNDWISENDFLKNENQVE